MIIGQVQTVCKGQHDRCVILSSEEDGKFFHADMKKLHGLHTVEVGAEARWEIYSLGGIVTVESWWSPTPDYRDRSGSNLDNT